MSERQQEQERTRIRLTVDRHSEAEPLGNGRVRVVEKITRTYEPFELTSERVRQWVAVRMEEQKTRVESDEYAQTVNLAMGDVIDGYKIQVATTQTIVRSVELEFRRLGFQIKEHKPKGEML